jgi:hypothetical protein
VSNEVRITDPKTGGQKGRKDERFELIPAGALEEVARVYGHGAAKYDSHNWARGYDWDLSIGALERHVALFKQGQDLDAESQLNHMAHAVFHCLTLITFGRYGLGTDNRLKLERKEGTQEFRAAQVAESKIGLDWEMPDNAPWRAAYTNRPTSINEWAGALDCEVSVVK